MEDGRRQVLAGRGSHALWAAAVVGGLLGNVGGAAGQTVEGTSVESAHAAAIERAMESRTLGDTNATVVVFEIADFQCPYCAQFAGTIAPVLHERYVETGDVQWVFVNLPLHSHPLAWHAAEAALCAGAAGDAFWPMHDRLFAEQEAWGGAADPRARFGEYAAALGVPAGAFAACIDEDHVAALILQDVGSAISAGITGTPTFIIMKDNQVVERLSGVQPVETWAEVLGRVIE